MQPEGPYDPLPSVPEEPPDAALLGSEAYAWDAVPNLDQFFTRIYRYWEAKGFTVLLLSRVLNLAALGFTVLMSALLLLYVNWGALQAECLRKDTCDIMEVAFRRHPLEGGLTLGRVLACFYLTAFTGYWMVALAHLLYEVRDLAEVRSFCHNKLGISERQMGTMTWPEVAHRVVQAQGSTRLSIVRDLSEHDVVSCIMRKENYLIAMMNKGVLALNLPTPGLRRHLLLTKTLEWNLYWCVLDALFDRHFRVKRSFLLNQPALKRRFRVLAALNLAASPFMLLFLLIYFFMKNAEKFYHHPSTIGARRWSPLAKWRLREFNELPHFITHRLNASHTAAERYIQQFPNYMLSHVARLVAFVSGSFAALLLVLALIDEHLLERELMGRQIVWWVATVGMVLALSRAFIIDSGVAFDPEAALMEVVAHTHYLPRHWRGRAHTREVQEQFEWLFQYKALLFLEELASILLTPFVLYFSLPKCAGAILQFVEENTTYIEGVGDVCSLAAFDFARHGNIKYGAPAEAPKAGRSRQGKMEKSFLSFAAAYPQWEPPEGAPRQFLSHLASQTLHPRTAPAAASVVLQQQGGSPGGPGLMAVNGLAGSAIAAQLPLASMLGSQLQSVQQLQGWLGRYQSPQMESGIFASAELEDASAAGAAWGSARAEHRYAGAELQRGPRSPGRGVGAAERVAFGQMLLQSLYEEQEDSLHQQQSQQQHVAGQQDATGPIPAYQHPAAHPPLPHQQQAAPVLVPRRQQQQQQHPGAAVRQQPSPSNSPRQTWTRPGSSPAVPVGRDRQLSSELSVLSREHSSSTPSPHSLRAQPPLAHWQAAYNNHHQQQQQQQGESVRQQPAIVQQHRAWQGQRVSSSGMADRHLTSTGEPPQDDGWSGPGVEGDTADAEVGDPLMHSSLARSGDGGGSPAHFQPGLPRRSWHPTSASGSGHSGGSQEPYHGGRGSPDLPDFML